MTALEADLADESDRVQLEFAHSQRRVLFTFNVAHFCRMHAELLAQGRLHSGIVVAPQQRYPVGEVVRRVLKLLAARTAEEMCGRLEFLSNWS